MNDTTLMTPDLDRLAERIEKAATLIQQLREERDRFAHERQEALGRAAALEETLRGQDPAALLAELTTLRKEQREWQAERREVATRIESLLKKLDRIDG